MREIIRFLQRNLTILTFLVFELISIFLLVRSNDYQRSLSNGFVSNVEGSIFRFFSNISGYYRLGDINRSLTEENAMLRKMLQSSFRDYDVDTLSYDSLLTVFNAVNNDSTCKADSKYNLFDFYPAKVVYNSTNNRNNLLIIDKGRLDGVSEGMGVISSQSIVGIVKDVTDHYSLVISVLNSNFKVGVKPKNVNEYGTVSWDGRKYSIGNVADLSSHVVLRENDTIVTSGLSKIFPPDIPMGLVKSVASKVERGVLDVDITFIDDYRSTTNVYVVHHIYSSEIDSLMLESYERSN